MPSSAHLIYIPLVMLVGVVFGFILGARAARNAFDMEQRRAEQRAAARARRAARRNRAAGPKAEQDAGADQVHTGSDSPSA